MCLRVRALVWPLATGRRWRRRRAVSRTTVVVQGWKSTCRDVLGRERDAAIFLWLQRRCSSRVRRLVRRWRPPCPAVDAENVVRLHRCAAFAADVRVEQGLAVVEVVSVAAPATPLADQ